MMRVPKKSRILFPISLAFFLQLTSCCKKFQECYNPFLNKSGTCAASPINDWMPKEGYIPVPKGQLYYQVIGKGEPIIVLHGGPGLDQTYLLPQMEKLSETNQVVFYDQRGSGKSISTPLHKETINLNQFVEDIEILRKTLGYKKFTLIGHSWGGMLAMSYAIRYPDKLSSLILLNSEPATSSGFKAFLNEYVQRTKPFQKEITKIQNSKGFAKGNPKDIVNLYRIIFKTYFYDQKDLEKLTIDLTSQGAMSGFKVSEIFTKTLFSKDYDLRPELRTLHIPTLIIHGDYDPIPVWTAEEIRDSIPGAELLVMEKCGHFPYIEHPDSFFYTIEDFLKKQGQIS